VECHFLIVLDARGLRAGSRQEQRAQLALAWLDGKAINPQVKVDSEQ
jgi:hypothetical protein